MFDSADVSAHVAGLFGDVRPDRWHTRPPSATLDAGKTLEKRESLRLAFTVGLSNRAAAKFAGCNRETANLWARRFQGVRPACGCGRQAQHDGMCHVRRQTMKRVVMLLVGVVWASTAFAQAAPTDRFAWDMAAPSLAEANGYRYDVEMDAVVLPTPLVATCTGAVSPFLCRTSIPAVTPTTHTARVRAVDTTGTPILGPFSDPVTFTMRATPAKPSGLTVVPGGL